MPEDSPEDVTSSADGEMPEESDTEGVLVRLHWGSADHLETIYVNHMVVNHTGPEFFVTFGELKVPPYLEKDEIPSDLEIEPKVRLVIAPDAIGKMVEVLQGNVNIYLHKKEQGKK